MTNTNPIGVCHDSFCYFYHHYYSPYSYSLFAKSPQKNQIYFGLYFGPSKSFVIVNLK